MCEPRIPVQYLLQPRRAEQGSVRRPRSSRDGGKCAQGPNGWPVDDVRFALADICSNGVLLATVFATVVSIAVFNWCGVCVTKRLSCTARLSIDACRTVLVWVASLLIGWESFSTAQLLGFIVLVCGSVLYNEMLSAVMLNAGCVSCSPWQRCPCLASLRALDALPPDRSGALSPRGLCVLAGR